jgi:hypothetical protein
MFFVIPGFFASKIDPDNYDLRRKEDETKRQNNVINVKN